MMFKTLPIALFALLFAFVSTGCDGGGEDDLPPPPADVRLQGSYTGTANISGFAITLNLALIENSNTVTGSGSLRGSEVVSVSASGTRVGNNFNMTLSNSLYDDLNFAGTVNASGTVMTGDLNGSGFDSVRLTLNQTAPLVPTREAESAKATASGLILDAIR